MSSELAEIISDLAKEKDSLFASIVYDSLCAELQSRGTYLTTLIYLLESKSSWEETSMYNLFTSYFIKQKKNFPNSSILTSIDSIGEEHSKKLEKAVQDSKKNTSDLKSKPTMNFYCQSSTNKIPDINHSQTPEVTKQPVEDAKAKDESAQLVNTACKTLSEELPDEKFKEVILTSVESYYEKSYSQLNMQCLKYIRQAHVYLNITFTFLSVGILALLAGVVLSFVLNPLLGATIASLGIICEIIGVLAFRLNIKSREKLSEAIKEINTLTKFRAAKLFINEITSNTKKDIALEKLINNILQHETS